MSVQAKGAYLKPCQKIYDGTFSKKINDSLK